MTTSYVDRAHARARLARRPARRACDAADQRGFTIMELLVVMGLAMLILGALSGFQRAEMFAIREQEIRVEAQSATRATLDVMLREIRMAGYGGPCPNDIAPVLEAQSDSIRIQIDWDENGVIGAGEDVTYAYDEATHEIQRTVVGENGDLAIPVIANVSSSDIFRYLDANGVETATLADVRSVSVDVRVERASPRPGVSSNIVSGLEAEVVVRNSGFECEEEDDGSETGDDDGSGGGDDEGDDDGSGGGDDEGDDDGSGDDDDDGSGDDDGGHGGDDDGGHGGGGDGGHGGDDDGGHGGDDDDEGSS